MIASDTSAPTTIHVPALAATGTVPVIDQASLSQSTSADINQSPPSHTDSQPNPSDIHTDSAPSNDLVYTSNTSDPLRLKAIEDGTTDDVTMRPMTTAVSPLPKSRNDDNLPTWLSKMVEYLHDVAEDTAWQDLVTEFFDFERHSLPNGVSFTASFMSFSIEHLFR